MKLIVLFVGLCVSVGVLCSNAKTDDISDKPGVSRSKRNLRESLARVNELLKSYYDKFNDKNELCSPSLNRRRRQLNRSDPNCLPAAGQNYYNRIEELAAELRGSAGAITTDVSNDNSHAVLDYTTIQAPANQNHPQPIDLTVTIRAHLKYDNTANTVRASGISAVITRRMQEMDWYYGRNRNTNDERGHLLADSLGGPSFPWNFVPQSSSVNRAVSIRGSSQVTFCWFDLEAEIRALLLENHDHYISWTILVGYRGLPTSRRPTGFMISVRLLTSQHQLISTRMFMIPNVPSDACRYPNHPFWHYQ